MVETTSSEGKDLCDEGRTKFLEGLALCASSAEAKEELKLLLLEVAGQCKKTPFESTLIKAYDEVVEGTDPGRKLKVPVRNGKVHKNGR